MNPYAHEIVACPACRDARFVLRGSSIEVRCTACEKWTDVERASARSAAAKAGPRVGIRRDQLTREEGDLFRTLCLQYPTTHPLTVLSWIEGQSYDPSKDGAFLAECQKHILKWQFLRGGKDEVAL